MSEDISITTKQVKSPTIKDQGAFHFTSADFATDFVGKTITPLATLSPTSTILSFGANGQVEQYGIRIQMSAV